MMLTKIIEKLIGTYVYIYVNNISKEFAGKIDSVIDNEILVVEDKNNNLINIPISEISVITERR